MTQLVGKGYLTWHGGRQRYVNALLRLEAHHLLVGDFDTFSAVGDKTDKPDVLCF